MSGPAFEVSVAGVERVLKALDPLRIQTDLQTSLARSAMIVARAAFDNVNGKALWRGHGALATSVLNPDIDKPNLVARIGTNLVYGPVHEFGATIRPKRPGGLLVFDLPISERIKYTPMGRHPWKRGKVTTTKVFAKKVTIPRRPWLMPAYEDNKDRIVDEFRAGLQRSLTP